MTHDHSDHSMAGDSGTDRPPDQASAGDVSTTGHSDRDVHGAHGPDAHAQAEDDHGGHGGHGHDDAAAEVPTLVPTTWRQLVFPALIIVLVGILVAGPIFNAFASRPVSPPNTEERHSVEGSTNEGASEGGGESAPAASTPESNTNTGGAGGAPPTSVEVAATPAAPAMTTEAPAGNVSSPTVAPAPTATTISFSPATRATRTAVSLEGEQGVVARVPVQMEFGSTSFVVKPGDNLLPDWKPTQDVGLATWIDGTVANHILYLPYNDENERLFKSAKAGDTLKVTMNTGDVFHFAVTNSSRVKNGPATEAGQFTVTTAMAQNHAGVTLFLIGDPATDRAVVQADFTGTIQ